MELYVFSSGFATYCTGSDNVFSIDMQHLLQAAPAYGLLTQYVCRVCP